MKTLVIAEKPSVARDIARVLGCSKKENGALEGNKYIVTWALGHLVTLKDPEDYDKKYKEWNMAVLPMMPEKLQIKVIPQTGKQYHAVTTQLARKDVNEIVIATDAGREGELVARWILDKAHNQKPCKRLWISSVTDKAIREGFANLKDAKEYDNLYRAAVSRAEADWLVGINATRALTCKYNAQLSCGRVQTPTLALIVNRQLEIQNFVPKQYWELKTVYRDTTFSAILRKSEEELVLEAEKQKEAIAAGKKPKKEEENRGIDPITDRERGLVLLDQIKNSPFTVTDVTKKEGREAPLRLFDLTSLQVECNKKFAYSADETLKIIQSLYEKKVATYPRVDTTYLSDDIYPKCPGILKGLRDYETFTAPLTGTALLKSKKVFDNSKVTDHHAIIPTGQHPQNLTDMERRVFDLIARRFIAVFYPDCKFATTTVLGEVESIEFKATGKQILEPGWRIIFGTPSAQSQEEKEEKGEEENVLPAFVKGESGPHVPDLYEKWTQPPRPYTEATLLRAMETAGKLVDNDELRDALKENGIGRPSTRAAIIETLFKRNYIRKEKKNLIATPTGVELIQIIHEELLKSAELTGIWEKKLREIERRTYNAGQFLEELKQMVSEVVMSVLSDNSNRHITIQAPAPEKGSKASAKTEAADKPKKEPKKRAPRKSAAAGKKTEQASGAVAASSTEASVQADDFVGQPCPLCGKGTVIKGKTAYGCSEWKSGCTFRKPFE